MEYKVIVVEDNELPLGTGWVIARRRAVVYLLITESVHAQPGGLGQAWLAWVKCGGFADPLPPVLPAAV